MKILDKEYDDVIGGVISIGFVKYEYALANLAPLIDKTEFQRKLQDQKFYQKLKRDIDDGCVMPPITIAFETKKITNKSKMAEIKSFIENNISNSFVLDGIQRLNTLSRLKDSDKIDRNKKLYINFLFCKNVDSLLYRMITLNNGQRPMTPRHQVEVMMANLFNLEEFGISIQSEKDRAKKADNRAFKKADIIQAYLAYMADSPLVDNKKIIQEKMDALLVNKIISSRQEKYSSEFRDVLKAIKKFHKKPECLKWLKIANNLIGFAVGMKTSSKYILNLSIDEFKDCIETFDEAFSVFNPSRIKVGKYRRELSCEYFKKIEDFFNYDSDELFEYFSEITADD